MAKKRLPEHLRKVCGMRKSNKSFSSKDCAAHICKVCSRLSLEQQTEQMTLRRLENLLPRRLTENEMTWLKNRTHGHRDSRLPRSSSPQQTLRVCRGPLNGIPLPWNPVPFLAHSAPNFGFCS